MLLDFLHATGCETLYLVGEIIDVWNMQLGRYWPQAHNNVIRTIHGDGFDGRTELLLWREPRDAEGPPPAAAAMRKAG